MTDVVIERSFKRGDLVVFLGETSRSFILGTGYEAVIKAGCLGIVARNLEQTDVENSFTPAWKNEGWCILFGDVLIPVGLFRRTELIRIG